MPVSLHGLAPERFLAKSTSYCLDGDIGVVMNISVLIFACVASSSTALNNNFRLSYSAPLDICFCSDSSR